MYSESVAKIGEAFDANPAKVTKRVGYFVLATIQQHFATMPATLDDWEEKGINAPTCWGNKISGVKYLDKKHGELAAQLATLRANRIADGHGAAVAAIDLLLQVPGLNTIKAAFFAQCLGFDVGCIDSHNAKMYSVKVSAFSVSPKHTAKTRLAKVASYVTLCNELGGSAYLWDAWCYLIADKYPNHFKDGETVSHLHTTLITEGY